MWKRTFLELKLTKVSGTVYNNIYRNDEQNLWLFKPVGGSKWFMAPTLGTDILVDGVLFTRNHQTINNTNFFVNTAQTQFLWKGDLGWTLTQFPGSGWMEWWATQMNPPRYQGNYFWVKEGGIDGTYQARGSIRGETFGGFEGTPKTVTTKTLEGWESSTFFGEYSPIAGGGQSGTKYVGWKKVTGNNGLGDLIATIKELNGEKVYDGDKKLWYDGANWIISNIAGTKDSAAGYWQGGAPPTPSATTTVYTLVYTGDPPNPTPASYTLTWEDYVENNQRSEEYIGQVAVWL